LFNAAVFVLTWTVMLLSLPLLAAPRRALREVLRFWARAVIVLLRAICGVRVELRGREHIPPGGCVLAAKHQSAFDTAIWVALLPDAAYVLKRELLSIPVYGWLVRKARMIPVDRTAAAPRCGHAAPGGGGGGGGPPGGDLPRGHPHRARGARALPAGRGRHRRRDSAPVLPVATDSGRIWGRRAFRKHPGIIRVSGAAAAARRAQPRRHDGGAGNRDRDGNRCAAGGACGQVCA
jgi:1-acyl-sn-glycerol-3-phosphate acyltransferase